MAILAGSPLVAIDRVFPYENRYLVFLCRLVRQIDTPFTPNPEWNIDQFLRAPASRVGPLPFSPLSLELSDFASRAARHLWAALSESMIAHSSGPVCYYAEKTFGDTVECLAAAGINVKLINLVRDPRDVVASIRAFDEKRGSYGFGRTRDQSEAEYLATLVTDMRGLFDRMWERATLHDHLWVRYEDMITDRAGTVDRLSRWLNVDLPLEGAPSRREYRRHRTSANPGQSIGRWHKSLSDDEVSYIESVLGEDMARVGYTRS